MSGGYDEALYLMYLGQVPMFRRCSKDELDRVAALGIARQADRGEVLVTQGDAADEFFVIASGSADVIRDGAKVATLEPGGYFGELALFDPAPRNATVTASSPTTVIALSRTAFGTALDDVPEIRDALLTGMAHRLHELDGTA